MPTILDPNLKYILDVLTGNKLLITPKSKLHQIAFAHVGLACFDKELSGQAEKILGNKFSTLLELRVGDCTRIIVNILRFAPSIYDIDGYVLFIAKSIRDGIIDQRYIDLRKLKELRHEAQDVDDDPGAVAHPQFQEGTELIAEDLFRLTA